MSVQSHILNESIGESRSRGGKKPKITLEKTLSLFKKRHKDLYDYSKFVLVDQNTKGIIICKKQKVSINYLF